MDHPSYTPDTHPPLLLLQIPRGLKMKEDIVKLASVVIVFLIAFPTIGATVLQSMIQGFILGIVLAAVLGTLLVYWNIR